MPSSPESFSVKAEPYSPRTGSYVGSSSISTGSSSFPPSPSGSDASSDPLTAFGPMDVSSDILTSPISGILNIGPLSNIECVTLSPGNVVASNNPSTILAGSVSAAVGNVSNGKAKIPIPKISKNGKKITLRTLPLSPLFIVS